MFYPSENMSGKSEPFCDKENNATTGNVKHAQHVNDKVVEGLKPKPSNTIGGMDYLNAVKGNVEHITIDGIEYIRLLTAHNVQYFKERASEANTKAREIGSKIQHITIDEIEYVKHVTSEGVHYFIAKTADLGEYTKDVIAAGADYVKATAETVHETVRPTPPHEKTTWELAGERVRAMSESSIEYVQHAAVDATTFISTVANNMVEFIDSLDEAVVPLDRDDDEEEEEMNEADTTEHEEPGHDDADEKEEERNDWVNNVDYPLMW